jgi:hypothetical protein
LRSKATAELKTSGTNVEGEQYRAVLTLDRSGISTAFGRRYVYVFAIDSAGASVLLFPPVNASRDENYLPVGVDSKGHVPEQIELVESDLTISPPFGVDTFVLLTTGVALPDPGVLTGDPVQSQSRGADSDSALGRLFAFRGSPRGAVTTYVPSEWSIERLTFGSKPAASGRPPK